MTITTGRALLRPERRVLTLTVLCAAALAWLALVLAGDALGHHAASGQHAHHAATPGLAAVATGWLLMVVAMMLPPALPLFDLLRGLAARHPWPSAIVATGVAAFVAVWAGAGVVLLSADALLRSAAGRWEWLAERPHLLAAAVLAVAGIYQLTPLASACLRACRTPRGFAVAHWHGARPPWAEASVVAGAYGMSCVGCCWALMAVSLAVGVAVLPVMVLLTAVMAAQRLARRGRALVRPTGVVLLLAAAITASGLVPL